MVDKYSLVVAEKPDAAERIASALSPRFRRLVELQIPYYELERNGRKIFVVPTSGHVYTVAEQIGGRNHYPIFTFKWVPKYLVEKNDRRSKSIIALFAKLGRDADELINAADYDIEGSLIGYMILKHACNGKEKTAKRMKFSTLTKEELAYAFDNLMPTLDFELVEVGRTRHEVDWLYGINLSRALTISAAKESRRYDILSIGRVQGPTLQFIVQREAEIKSFIPIPFWEIKATVEIDGKEYTLELEKGKIYKKSEADELSIKCSGKMCRISMIDEKEVHGSPPEPFDIGTLQREAYRFFGYTPRKTINVAERLYLNALTSYPRTSSQKLPQSIRYREILGKLCENPVYESNAKILLREKELKPKEGRKDDPAHPAIYPTGVSPSKAPVSNELRIYDLIVKRFMSVFGDPSLKLSTKITFECEGYRFLLYGGRVVYEGWMKFYRPYIDLEEKTLPSLNIGMNVFMKKIDVISRFTEPPPRYNPASLLKAMEENILGTKATRADIIETLYERGYMRDEKIVATNIGFAVADVLSKFCPEITSVQLTRNLEEKMEKIASRMDKRETVLSEAVDNLKHVLARIKMSEIEVGSALYGAMRDEKLRERIVGPCPQCKTGNLMILRSRKTAKRFIGCSNFFEGTCRTAMPLPQKGTVQGTGKLCKFCSWPIILLRFYRRRPFQTCINISCPSKPAKS